MADCPISSISFTINREECIGNSLPRINDNFELLKAQSCSNYTRLEDIDNSISKLQSLFANLSANTTPGIARAWCKFDGTRDSSNVTSTFFTDRFIYSHYNIASVYRKGAGDYRIYFQTPFSSRNYAVVGTSSQTLSPGNSYTWLQPYTYTSAYVDMRVHGNVLTDRVDPKHVSIVLF